VYAVSPIKIPDHPNARCEERVLFVQVVDSHACLAAELCTPPRNYAHPFWLNHAARETKKVGLAFWFILVLCSSSFPLFKGGGGHVHRFLMTLVLVF
jgi:hypothetical protein